MEARITRLAILVTALACFATSQALAASHRTENFIVTAPTPRLAKLIGDAAEQFRQELAVEWLGEEMRPWARPCPITAQVSPQLGAGGATSFVFHHGEVFGWEMVIQGSEERILDSVLPHEVTHTIFATHFRQPLPRWADEGACTTVEHHSEKMRHQKLLIDFLKTGRGIPMDKLFAMTEYPENKAEVLPLYSQAFSVARYMIQHGGKRKFVAFVEDGLQSGDWSTATRSHYGYNDLANLQHTWLDWVRNGSPQLGPATTPPNTAVAVSQPPASATPTTFAPHKNEAAMAVSVGANPNAVAAASYNETPRSNIHTPSDALRANALAAGTPGQPITRQNSLANTQSLPVNWQAVPPPRGSQTAGPNLPAASSTAASSTAASSTAASSTAAASGPPQRYQAVRQQPPQRPQQRVLR